MIAREDYRNQQNMLKSECFINESGLIPKPAITS